MLSRTRTVIGACGAIVLASLALAAGASPSAAQNAPDAPVVEDGDELVGGIREQVNVLQSGSPGSGGPRSTCSWTQTLPDGQTVERDDGTPRWREPRLGHDQWATNWEDWEGEEVGGGTIFRYECWHPEMGCGTESLVGGACMGEQIRDTFCGDSLCLFDAVNPPNLARLAVDGFVQSLPDPAPGFSPQGPTLVNFDTYLWLTNAPPGGQVELPPMTVPGLTVTASATASDIVWTMGDGESKTCPITTDETSAAAAGCSYAYNASSAGQGDDDTYRGSVAMTFDVQWQATGVGAIDGSLVAERSSSFSLAVNEAQAINTNPG